MSEGEPSVPFQPGEFIADKYRVERLLGAGGMGVVVEATHVDLERKVAVKLIRAELAKEPSVTERLKLEARAAAKIQSEHVGKVLDVGTLPSGAPYIVMEYLEGQDLCQVLETRGALRVTQAIDYVMQACEALAEAHAAQIVHRDLKPENLFVARQPDGSSIIKVLDFGISKQLGGGERRQLTNPSTAVGSPRYMAPEQMQGGNVDVRADIWSLGAILYECLSNVAAFDSETLPGICAQVLGQEPRQLRDLAPHVPDRLAAVIMRCLIKAREQRFQDVAQLADALAPFGTDRADLSRRRIAALLGGTASVDATQHLRPSALIDAQGQTAVVDTGSLVTAPGHNATPNNTVGRGVALDVAASSRVGTGEVPKRAVWPFVALPVGALAIAATAFVWLGSSEDGADEAGLEPPASTANVVAAAPPSSQPPSEPASPPNEVTSVAATEQPGDSPEPLVAPVSTEGPVPNKKNPKAPRKEPPKKAPNEEAEKKPADAWDPNSFGGRE